MKLKENKVGLDKNIRHEVTCAYDREIDPEIHSDRCMGDMCRCTTIEGAKVTEYFLGHIDLAREILGSEEDIFNVYFLSRFLAHNRWSFDIEIGGGYYGQEIEAVYLDSESKSAINTYIGQFNEAGT